MIEKLDRENFNFFKRFELRDINVLPLSDVEKNTIRKEQKSLNVKMLSPAQTQIEEEL
jgi:hypothetical protein